MGLRDLFFSITARDKTGSAFSNVNKRLRETEGRAASAAERIDRVGASMRRIGAAGSVGSAGIAAIFRDSISLYDEQARAEAKVAEAIKSTGGAAGLTADELKRAASNLQGLTRFGDEKILGKVTAQFVGFGNIVGDTLLRAQELTLDLAAKTDKGLGQTAERLGAALADPARGLTRLTRAGVLLDEQQQDLIKTLAETGDVAGAQKIILDAVAESAGGQAKAAREAGAGIVDAWSNTWGDVKEVVGGALVEMLPPIIKGLQTLTSAFQDMAPGTQRAVVAIGALAVALPPVTLALGVMATGLAALTGPVGLVVAGIAGLTAVVVKFWPEIKAASAYLSDTFAAATTAAGDAAGRLLDTIRDTFTAIPKIIGDTVNAAGEWINGKFTAILDSLGAKVEWVEGKFAWLYDKVVGNSWVPDMIEEVGASFAELQGNMVRPTDEATGAVNASFENLGSAVGSKLSNLARDGKLSWESLFGGMLDIGADYADRIVSEVFGKIGDGLSGLMSGGSGGSGGGFLGGLGGSLFDGLGSAISGLIPGLDQGGTMTVGGRAGVDRNLAAVRLSQGESVKVERAHSRDNSGGNVTVNIHTPDPRAFHASRAQVGQQIGRAVAAGRRGM